MENTKIEWATHTFNPWIGCTKVSAGCSNCYAEKLMDGRFGRVKWGKGQPRSRTKNWGDPVRWNKEAAGAQERPRVFCASLADWLDDEVPIEWFCDLLELIFATPFFFKQWGGEDKKAAGRELDGKIYSELPNHYNTTNT